MQSGKYLHCREKVGKSQEKIFGRMRMNSGLACILFIIIVSQPSTNYPRATFACVLLRHVNEREVLDFIPPSRLVCIPVFESLKERSREGGESCQ